MINRLVIFGSVRTPEEHQEWMADMRASFQGDEAAIKSVLEELDRRGSIPMALALNESDVLDLKKFIPVHWPGYVEHRLLASRFYQNGKQPHSHFSLFASTKEKETRFPLWWGTKCIKSQYAICGWDQDKQQHVMLHCVQCVENFILWLNDQQNEWRDASLPAPPKEPTHVAPTRLQ